MAIRNKLLQDIVAAVGGSVSSPITRNSLLQDWLDAILSGESPFSPLDLFQSGEQGAWYDPSDLTTLFQDAAGTIPVVSDGDPVGLMQDKSGNGSDATQSVSASRPTYRTDGTLHWLEFDGVDDGISTTSTVDFTASSTMSFITGSKRNNNNITILAELSPTTDSSNGSFFALSGNWSGGYGGVGVRGSTTRFVTQIGVSDQIPEVIYADSDINASQINVYYNGVFKKDSTESLGSGPFGDHKIFIGSRNESSLRFNGNIYSLVVVDRVLIEGERTDVNDYSIGKSGVVI
jgi:hypothetical protein